MNLDNLEYQKYKLKTIIEFVERQNMEKDIYIKNFDIEYMARIKDEQEKKAHQMTCEFKRHNRLVDLIKKNDKIEKELEAQEARIQSRKKHLMN